MSFKERPVEQILEEYKEAIDWVNSFIPNIKPTSRIYKYLELLETYVRLNREGVNGSFSLLDVLDAHQKSDLLIQIYKKFQARREKEFIDKLSSYFFGPVNTHDEVLHGSGPSKSSYGRDIESEFYFATKVKEPEIVSFQGNDVVYDLKEFKFGVEVKRIHSLDKIEKNFEIACNQIETAPSVKYGMVGFRFDNHFLKKTDFGVELIDRSKNILNFEERADCFKYAEYQTKFFAKKYGQSLLELSKSFPKVLGFSVFGQFPGKINTTGIPFLAGHFSYCWFGGVGKPSQDVFVKMTNEFENP